MCEIDVHAIVTGDTWPCYGSKATHGANAGPDTWAAATAFAAEKAPMMTAEQREAFRDYMKGFGAWDADEIAGWSDVECDALLTQLVTGDFRELPEGRGVAGINWKQAERDSAAGQISGRLFVADRGPAAGRVHYQLD